MVTNYKNELWKTVRWTSFQKPQLQSVSFFFKFFHPYFPQYLRCHLHLLQTFRAVMHQSIPAAFSGYCGAFACLFSPGGGAFANFAMLGNRVFANPGAIPELLTRTRFPIRMQLQRGYYWKKSRLAHLWRTGDCMDFIYACIFSLLIKPQLHEETRELSTWIKTFFG